MKIKSILSLLGICLALSLHAQTVGVLSYTNEVEAGLTLFAPLTSPSNEGDVYLIDECGQLINFWEFEGNPGMMGKLTNEGNLLFNKRNPSNIFNGGGMGGRLSAYDWDNNLLYDIELADLDFHQHHDIEILPNGNILMVGWDLISPPQAENKGRLTVPPGGLWSERIREIKPLGGSDYEIVWEWRVWDHLVQNVADSIPNYGEIVENPHRINVNYTNSTGPMVQDWLHVNSLDYNPQLDQIIVNCRNFSEFWIIDHSTTIEEAAGSTGGNSGKGGDILYRWGNPETYEAGTSIDQDLYAQHDAHWIPAGIPGEGKIAVFNNGLGRPEGPYSTIDIIDPLIIDDEYAFVGDQFGPLFSDVLYGGPEGQEQHFFSSRISGSQHLPNGNTLICVGQRGRFIEINLDKEIVWEYLNPVGQYIATQGDQPPSSNSVFQTVKYPYDFIGFENKDLTPGEKIELEPTDNCDLLSFSPPLSSFSLSLKSPIIENTIELLNPSNIAYNYKVYNQSGNLILKSNQESKDSFISFDEPIQGMYFLVIYGPNNQTSTFKLLKIYE